MIRDELLELFNREERIEAEYPQMRREATAHVVRHVGGPAQGSFVIHSRLDAECADRVIQEEIAYFQALGQGFEWKVYDHDSPPDLRERLIARGFEADEPEAVEVLELGSAPSALLAPAAHEVRRFVNPDRLPEIVAIHHEVWQKDRTLLARKLADEMRAGHERFAVYGAYSEGKLVSAGWVRFPQHSSFASLWGGATLPAYRRRGFYTALLTTRVAEARRRGYRFAAVDARPMSRPILERYGFERLTFAHACNWQPASSRPGR